MVHIDTILQELGAGYEDVRKLITMNAGGCGDEAIHANLPKFAGCGMDRLGDLQTTRGPR